MASTRDAKLSCQHNDTHRPPLASPGAHLTFDELQAAGPAQLPPEPVDCHTCCIVHPGVASCVGGQPNDPDIILTRADHNNSEKHYKNNRQWTYRRLLSKKPISLHHHHPGWGQVWFATATETRRRRQEKKCNEKQSHATDHNSNTNNTTNDNTVPTIVAVKQLHKGVVADYLLAGGPENPYAELAHLQAFAQESVVLDCWEALEDAHHLYMVTPAGISLYDVLFSAQRLSSTRIHHWFVQLLHILCFLEAHDIHHRDLSPDNLIVLPPNDRLVVMDFALAMRLPRPRRLLQSAVGTFGTHAYMAPELVTAPAFDGVAADLWSVMVIFYNLHTRHKLYDQPLCTDWSYVHFCLRNGLCDDAWNTTIWQNPSADVGLRRRAAAHLAWSDPVRQLMSQTLRACPSERWTLGQVIQSDYVQQHSPS